MSLDSRLLKLEALSRASDPAAVPKLRLVVVIDREQVQYFHGHRDALSLPPGNGMVRFEQAFPKY
jgi:hypothetical protein